MQHPGMPEFNNSLFKTKVYDLLDLLWNLFPVFSRWNIFHRSCKIRYNLKYKKPSSWRLRETFIIIKPKQYTNKRQWLTLVCIYKHIIIITQLSQLSWSPKISHLSFKNYADDLYFFFIRYPSLFSNIMY